MFRSLIKALLLFVLLGPLVGLLALLIQASSAVAFSSSRDLLLIPFSYLFGAAPALATGFSAWLLRERLRRYSGMFWCGVIGASAATVFWWTLPQSPLPWESIASLGAIPGAAAGIVCGLIYFWPPNNSFKPKPLRGSA